ncbi:hypothetical protein ACLOJK_035234 [Asimina triloba]
MAAGKEENVAERDALADSLNHLFTSVSAMVRGELQGTSNQLELLEKMNIRVAEEYNGFGGLASALRIFVEQLKVKNSSFDEYVEQIDAIDRQVTEFEAVISMLDKYCPMYIAFMGLPFVESEQPRQVKSTELWWHMDWDVGSLFYAICFLADQSEGRSSLLSSLEHLTVQGEVVVVVTASACYRICDEHDSLSLSVFCLNLTVSDETLENHLYSQVDCLKSVVMSI